MTSEPASSGGGEQLALELTWSPADSPVSRLATRVIDVELPTSGGYGPRSSTSFAVYDPVTCSWRTSQVYLDGEQASFSETWPRAGMTRNGTAYQLPPSAPLTDVTGGSAWPTPMAADGGKDRGSSAGWGLRDAVRKFPTPRASDGDRGGRGDLLAVVRTGLPSGRKSWPTPQARDGHRRSAPSEAVAARRWGAGKRCLEDALSLSGSPGGQLNPTWVEWLMGFPSGWTDLGP